MIDLQEFLKTGESISQGKGNCNRGLRSVSDSFSTRKLYLITYQTKVMRI